MIKYHHCPMTWSYHITWLHDDDHMLDLEVLWSDMWSWFTSKTNKMITWDGCHWYWDTITKITQFHTFWEKLCCLNIIAASLKQVLYGFKFGFPPTKQFWTQPEWKFRIKCFFPGFGGGFLIGSYSYFANTVMKKFKVSVLMSADKAFTKVATQPLRKLLFVEKRSLSSLDIWNRGF